MPDRRRAEVDIHINVASINLEGADITGEIDVGDAGKDTTDFAKNLALLGLALPKIGALLRKAGAAMKLLVNPYVLAGAAFLASAIVAIGIPLAKIVILARLAGRALKIAFQLGLAAVQKLAAGVKAFVDRGLRAVREFGQSAITVFAEFEQQVANTTTVLGAFGKQAGAMRSQIMGIARDISLTSRKMATDIAEAGYHIASAGFGAVETFGAMRSAVVLAEATLSNLGRAAETTVATINQFSLGQERFIDVANVFAAAIAKSPATLDKLRSSLEYVGPVASQFGESLEGTVAALMALYKTGRVGARAGTELRNVFNALARQTDKATEVLAEVGVNIEDLSPATHTIEEIVAQFEALRERIGQANFAMIANRAFTMRAASGILALTTIGSREIARMEEAITGTNTAFQMQADQIKTLAGIWDILKSDMQDVRIEIARNVSKVFYGLLKTVHELFLVLRERGVFAAFGDTLADIARPLRPFVEALADIATRYAPKVVEFFERAGKAARSVLWQGLNLVVNALERGIPWLLEFGDSMLDLVEKVNKPEVWETLNTVMAAFQEIIEAVAHEIVDRLKAGLPKVVEWFKKFGDAMPKVVAKAKEAVKWLGDMADVVQTKLMQMAREGDIERMIKDFAALAGTIRGVALALNVLAQVLNGIFLIIWTVGGAILTLFGTVVLGILGTFEKLIFGTENLWKAIDNLEQAWVSGIKTIWRSGRDLQYIYGMIDRTGDSLDRLKELAPKAGDALRDMSWPPEGAAPSVPVRPSAARGAPGVTVVAPAGATAGAGTVVGPFYIDGSKQAGRIAKTIIDEHTREEERATRLRNL